jgi:hypothetical protein
MAGVNPPAATLEPVVETYSHRDNPAIEAWMAARTATREAAFFLPYLRPGMRILDVGCVPGRSPWGSPRWLPPAR